MAEILLTTVVNRGDGLDVHEPIRAFLRDIDWPCGGVVSSLWLHVGGDSIRIWPVDPRHMRELANRLALLAKEEEVLRTQRQTKLRKKAKE